MRFRERTLASFNLAVMPGALQQIDLVGNLSLIFDFSRMAVSGAIFWVVSRNKQKKPVLCGLAFGARQLN